MSFDTGMNMTEWLIRALLVIIQPGREGPVAVPRDMALLAGNRLADLS
jgi:hypothetical protein